MIDNANHVQVLRSPTKGRYLVAISDIPPNTVILREQAYASVSKSPLFCSSCFYKFSIAQKNRPFLCPSCYVDYSEPFGTDEKSLVILCYKVVLQVILEDGFSYEQYFELSNCRFSKLTTYSSNFTAISQLLAGDLDVDLQDVNKVSQLLSIQSDKLSKEQLVNLVKHVFSTFQYNVQGIRSVMETDNGTFVEQRIGSGIYPTLALMNHSCSPNTRIYFEKSHVVVSTIAAVRKGQELHHNYGPNVLHHPKRQRQEMLSRQYGFVCDCADCSVDREPAYSLKCEECAAPVWMADLACTSCSGQIHRHRYVRRVDSIMAKLCSLDEHPGGRGVSFVDGIVDDAKSLYSPNSTMLGNIMDSCAACYASNKHWIKSFDCSRISCDIVRSYAGHSSQTYALELAKFCATRIKSDKNIKSKELIDDVSFSLKILENCKIYDSKMLKLLKGWLKEVC